MVRVYACEMEQLTVEPVERTDEDDGWRAWFVAGIQRGLDDIDAGRTFSDEEVAREMDEFFDALEVGAG